MATRLKHTRKFKLVPVDDSEGTEHQHRQGDGDGRIVGEDFSPPAPPEVRQMGLLDREMRAILEDPTLTEEEKMIQYEAKLSKWGKFYRHYQATEDFAKERSNLASSSSPSSFSNSPFSLAPDRRIKDSVRDVSTIRHSTPKTPSFTFKRQPTVSTGRVGEQEEEEEEQEEWFRRPTQRLNETVRSRSRSPIAERHSESELFTTPSRGSPQLAVTNAKSTPVRRRRKGKKEPAQDRRLTPPQAYRWEERLRKRSEQTGNSWLPWRPY